MKLVSASKLRRAQGSVVSARPYKDKLKDVLSRLVASAGAAVSDPLLEVREVKRVGYVVFASNKGLAGGYNANIMKEALVVEVRADVLGGCAEELRDDLRRTLASETCSFNLDAECLCSHGVSPFGLWCVFACGVHIHHSVCLK